MKKLYESINKITKPKSLKDFIKTEIKDELINFDYPNVGKYVPGSRTSIRNN